ncbi:MAG: DUF177 domain-containing protein [Clostridiales bacterium]|jgi:uncharacterized protein|nr:DUF177 domain-containing protein [Clostridiales bacterium]
MIKYDTRKIRPNESISIDTTVDIAMPRGFDAADTAVAVVGSLKNAGGRFVLDARADCLLVSACSRCLVPVEYRLSFHIDENFVEEDEAADEDIEFSDHVIDIYPAIFRNFLLNIPMKPLCAEDCAGLCPGCGKDLNQGDCDCAEEVNEQFSKLLQFFSD